jgi:putative serine protease PepD
MPDGTEPRRRSRGPAAGHLWSGQAGPEAPPPPPPTPLPETPIYRPSAPEEPPPAAAGTERRGSVWPRALAGGALSGVVVAAVAFAIAGPLTGDDGGSGGNAQPPAIVAAKGANSATSVGKIYAAASPAVASVQTGGGSGTGFLIDSDGTLVTNAHVVGSSDDVRVKFGDDGSMVRGTVVGRDTSTDLAVVRVDSGDVDDIRPLQFADSKNVDVGDLAVAIGNPLGLPQTATAGIVSGLGREIQAPDGFQIDEVIQTDAPINPGNSGGPLLDERGRVIGVNSQIATSGAGGGNIGIGFAVPSNTAREVVPQLEQGQAPKRPWLGLSTSPAAGGGAEVQSVTPGSPADRAGLDQGDVIVGVDGQRVADPDDVASAITDNEPGDEIGVELRRGGTGTEDLRVRLGDRPQGPR